MHEVTGGFWQVSEVWFWKVRCLEVDLVLNDIKSTGLGLDMLEVPAVVLLAGSVCFRTHVTICKCSL